MISNNNDASTEHRLLVENNNFSLQNSDAYALKATKLTKVFKNGIAYFNKTNTIVLDQVNINIAKNKIYALLGPSGCGKTTLLKCLIGILEHDKGEIYVDQELLHKQNKKINLQNLGYMPQETCLFSELTITEIFFYFGKLYSMTSEHINQKEKFLIELLNLPDRNMLISNLSGGQARRTSLAVSLLNNPKFLILDEPTVGLDPMLRKKIWDYLENLAHQNNTTILITTHYIEETREADCLGFMRRGQIIEENSPKSLMTKHKTQILEEVFYRICSNQQNQSFDENIVDETDCLLSSSRIQDNSNENQIIFSPNIDQHEYNLVKKVSNYFSWDRAFANVYKDSLKCFRNKKLLFIQFLIPIIQITFFCLCIGGPLKKLPIGFLNYETSPSLGRLIINEMDNETLDKLEYKNYDSGYQDLKNGKIWSFFVVDKNFSQDLMFATSNKQMANNFSNVFHIYSDNTNQQISLAIRNAIFRAVKKLIDEIKQIRSRVDNLESLREHADSDDSDFNKSPFETMDEYLNNLYLSNLINAVQNEKQIKKTQPSTDNFDNFYFFKFENPIYGTNEALFTNFMAPGVALSVIFFISVASTASNFEFEKRVGLTERAFITGVKTVELLVSQLLVYSILMVIQVFIILSLLFWAFKLPLEGSFILLILLLLSQGFCGLSYGLSLASIFHGEETVIQVTLASFYPMLLMSGIIWPIEAQPEWLSTCLSKLLPLTYATDSFRAILEKDWGIMNDKVFKGFLTTYLWTILFLIVFLVMFSHKSRSKQ
nr:ATP-binding cassette subfamily H-like 2 [Brachionus rubens]